MASATNFSSRPLLTIAVPTFNRSVYLRELLEVLLPQLEEVEDVELLISDNASPDGTAEMLAELLPVSPQIRSIRQPENIGSDRNFVFCFREARGKYFWLFGDDDILRPAGLRVILDSLRNANYDLVYVTPYGFHNDWRTEWSPDPYQLGAQIVRSARDITLQVHVGITFITAVISNRDRWLTLGAESPESFVGTNLTQLSWTLPLIRHHQQSLILWQRFISGRSMNSGGYNVADVFGARFLEVVHRLLPDRPRLANIFTNIVLRRWFPLTIVELRQRVRDGKAMGLDTVGTEQTLRTLFGRNFRFWLFTWPVLWLPLRLAKIHMRLAALTSTVIHHVQMPAEGIRKLRGKRYF
jgi:glycosyltransferase involved in cell wall biosynthesis